MLIDAVVCLLVDQVDVVLGRTGIVELGPRETKFRVHGLHRRVDTHDRHVVGLEHVDLHFAPKYGIVTGIIFEVISCKTFDLIYADLFLLLRVFLRTQPRRTCAPAQVFWNKPHQFVPARPAPSHLQLKDDGLADEVLLPGDLPHNPVVRAGRELDLVRGVALISAGVEHRSEEHGHLLHCVGPRLRERRERLLLDALVLGERHDLDLRHFEREMSQESNSR